MKKSVPYLSLLLVLFFTAIYILFPTANSTSDAFGYASYPKIGPHHLLYDWLCKMLLFATDSPEKTLAVLKIINGLCAGAILLTVHLFLKKTGSKQGWLWVLFAGSCFGFMRFATENETYIIPILFSMVGTYFLLFSEREINYPKLILAFLFLGTAILFHQIHLMWFLAACLALVLKKGFNWRVLMVPFLVFILVILRYQWQANFLNENLFIFLKGDMGSETVQLVPGGDNFKFTAINFVRSFLQIHGLVFLLYKRYLIVKIALIVSALLLVCAGLIKVIGLKELKKSDTVGAFLLTRSTLVWAFVFHLLFAWYSVGNAEFMVMLPILITLVSALTWNINSRVILLSGLGLFTWNITTGIIPNHCLNYENMNSNIQKVDKLEGYFISNNKVQLENYYLFKKYHSSHLNIIFYPGIFKSPADMPDDSIPAMHKKIALFLNDSAKIYTDCIDYPAPISRKTLLNKNKNTLFFSHYKLLKHDSFDCFYGRVYIYEVRLD